MPGAAAAPGSFVRGLSHDMGEGAGLSTSCYIKLCWRMLFCHVLLEEFFWAQGSLKFVAGSHLYVRLMATNADASESPDEELLDLLTCHRKDAEMSLGSSCAVAC